MNQFTSQELDLLIDAVGVWERSQCGSPHPMAVMIAGMMGHTCNDPDCENCRNARAQVERDTKERNAAAKLASERSIMLRAKLIGLRDGLAADKAFDEAGKE